MKKSDDAIPEFLRTARWRVAIYLFLVAVLIGLIGYLVGNTLSLTKVLDEDAKIYAADIMRRSERDVAARIISLQDRARGLASGFRIVPDDKLDDVLERLDDTSVVFDGMLLVSPDGIVAQSGEIIKGVPEWAMAVEDPFSFMDVGSVTGLDLLISVPVPGAERPLALVCQQSDSSLNQALEGALFDNLCFSCIVNGQGEIAVMPETPLPEDEFENITSQSTREYFASIIDAVEREAGDTDEEDFVISSVTNTKGSESYMACVPLDFGDWYLMTFVPVRLFTRHADVFIQRYWAPIILILLLFVALLAVIWRGHVERTSELKNMLYVDPLTGGLTDAAFQKRARDLAKRNSGAPYNVVCFRVLAFHNVNECYGADVSYAMIRAIHDALVGAVAADELVARCERDRFYLLVHAKDLDVLQARVDELIEVMRRAAEEIAPMGSFTVAQGCCSAEEEKENFRLMEDHAARAASHSERLGRCVFIARTWMRRSAARSHSTRATMRPSRPESSRCISSPRWASRSAQAWLRRPSCAGTTRNSAWCRLPSSFRCSSATGASAHSTPTCSSRYARWSPSGTAVATSRACPFRSTFPASASSTTAWTSSTTSPTSRTAMGSRTVR